MSDITFDKAALARLAKALAFICGPDHATTKIIRTAGETGAERDVKAARAAFLKLSPGDRRAALSMLSGGDDD